MNYPTGERRDSTVENGDSTGRRIPVVDIYTPVGYNCGYFNGKIGRFYPGEVFV